MVNVSGKSLVPVNLQQLQVFLNSVVPVDKLPEFNVKVDGREKVKSVFAKLEDVTLTIYTGAIVNLGLQKFSEVPDIVSQLMLFCLYGIKKAGEHVDFEIKSTDAGVNECKTDPAFQMLSGNIGLFVDRFKGTMVPVAEPVVQVTEVVAESVVETKEVKPKKKVANESAFKNVPLTDVPQIEVPANLDLIGV